MKLPHHAPGPVLPMSKLPIREGSREGMIEQSSMSPSLCLLVNSFQRAGFGFTDLMLPVESRQHLTQ